MGRAELRGLNRLRGRGLSGIGSDLDRSRHFDDSVGLAMADGVVPVGISETMSTESVRYILKRDPKNRKRGEPP